MGDIVCDRILMQGWIIYPKGEKLYATTPKGKDVQIEMIDLKNILGVQPETPPDYVAPPDVFTTSVHYQNNQVKV